MPDEDVRKFQSLVRAINPRLPAPVLKRLAGFCQGLDQSVEAVRVVGASRTRKMVAGKVRNYVRIEIEVDSPEIVPQKL